MWIYTHTTHFPISFAQYDELQPNSRITNYFKMQMVFVKGIPSFLFCFFLLTIIVILVSMFKVGEILQQFWLISEHYILLIESWGRLQLTASSEHLSKLKWPKDITLISFKEAEEQMRSVAEEIRSVSGATLPERTAALKPPLREIFYSHNITRPSL